MARQRPWRNHLARAHWAAFDAAFDAQVGDGVALAEPLRFFQAADVAGAPPPRAAHALGDDPRAAQMRWVAAEEAQAEVHATVVPRPPPLFMQATLGSFSDSLRNLGSALFRPVGASEEASKAEAGALAATAVPAVGAAPREADSMV